MIKLIRKFLIIIKNILYYKTIFGYIDYKATINKPLSIDSPSNIYIGRVYIGKYSWLAAVPLTDARICRLTIKDGCQLGHFNHIYATGEIIIENNVLTADKVYISDNIHQYLDVSTPIIKQPIVQKSKVVIGEGTWLGENVCVIGASIGRNCVIGANSVVTHDIPDYCVAVGSPARIIKRYNLDSKIWEKTNALGEFVFSHNS